MSSFLNEEAQISLWEFAWFCLPVLLKESTLSPLAVLWIMKAR